MAKLHVRHMVGGRAATRGTSGSCRFEFPERPGALMQFLDTLGGRWNISLFHYRNHGADFGRVLAGFEVPDARLAGVPRVPRRRSATPTCRETDNPAYRLVPRYEPAGARHDPDRARQAQADALAGAPLRGHGRAPPHPRTARRRLRHRVAVTAEPLHRLAGRMDAHVQSRRRCAGLHGAGVVGRVPAGGDVPGKHACGMDARSAGYPACGCRTGGSGGDWCRSGGGSGRSTGRTRSSCAPDSCARSAAGGRRWGGGRRAAGVAEGGRQAAGRGGRQGGGRGPDATGDTLAPLSHLAPGRTPHPISRRPPTHGGAPCLAASCLALLLPGGDRGVHFFAGEALAAGLDG